MGYTRFRAVFIEPLDNMLFSNAEKAAFTKNRSTFIPIARHGAGENIVLKNGETVWLNDNETRYLKKLINDGIVADVIVDNISDHDFNFDFDRSFNV